MQIILPVSYDLTLGDTVGKADILNLMIHLKKLKYKVNH